MQGTPAGSAILHGGPDGAPKAAPLDLHEGISDPGGCQRWPEHLRLRRDDGVMVRGRCRSTNLCAYCAKLAAVENSEVLALDAMTTGGPQLYAVLSTRSTSREPAAFYESRRQVFRAVKRRWPEAEYAAIVEFTTGRAGTSGGKRRPHWNLLIKGVGSDDLAVLSAVVVRVWCDREDALPSGQYLGEVAHAGGLMRYLALHFHKESQAPPHGWRGHRFMHSRGYFPDGITTMRALAQDNLKLRRVMWRITEQLPDLDATTVHDLAADVHAQNEAHSWDLHRLYELAGVPVPARRVRPPEPGAADAVPGVELRGTTRQNVP